MAAQRSSISVQQARFAVSAGWTSHCRSRHQEYGSICDPARRNIGGRRSSPLVPIRQGSLRLELRSNPALHYHWYHRLQTARASAVSQCHREPVRNQSRSGGGRKTCKPHRKHADQRTAFGVGEASKKELPRRKARPELWKTIFRKEADGTGGSRRYGYSDVARIKEAAAIQARQQATETRTKLEERQQQVQMEMDKLTAEIETQMSAFRQSQTGDFLRR